jgi:RimJ/RimL family protein N-acetyltransferase
MSLSLSDDLLVGKLVRLTAQRYEDREAMARWTNDVELNRLWDDTPVRPRTVDYFTDLGKGKDSDYRRFEFAVRPIGDETLIGVTELSILWVHQVAWLGMGIGEPEYRGKGYGTDALRLTVNYAFRELNMYRVSLSFYSYNLRARHVYEKAGFVHEGVRRGALQRDGQRYDEIMMGLLRSEWEQVGYR